MITREKFFDLDDVKEMEGYCVSCDHYHRDSKEYAVCIRFPPVLTSDTTSAYPYVEAMGWCGEWSLSKCFSTTGATDMKSSSYLMPL